MQPDSTVTSTLSSVLNDPVKLVGFIATILGILAAIVGIIGGITGLWQKWLERWQERRLRKILRKRTGAELYTPEEIIASRRYYICPDCFDVDPAQEAEIRSVHAVRGDLFRNVDKLLESPHKNKYLIVLADSGMGKTSFLINYWYCHWRDPKRQQRFNLAIVPLGIDKADAAIQEIPDKSNTVLFLDAFDEDARAIQNHRRRLETLIRLTQDFRQVLLTSRTQFFLQEEEIPRETGLLKTGPKGLDGAGTHVFYKLYLAPFSDEQVTRYLKRRFSYWQRDLRKKAQDVIDKIPLLSVRPMILSHIQDLVLPGKEFTYTFQLYEEIVTQWLQREKPFVQDTEALREFSEKLALNLVLNRQARGGERIHYQELLPLAQQFKILLEDWQLRGRSLLNRDAVGNYKFAHRSIMEYLFVKRFLEMNADERPYCQWTEQMYQFLEEKLAFCELKDQPFPNLSQINLSHFQKLKLRYEHGILSSEDVEKMLREYDFFDRYKNKSGKGVNHRYLSSGKKEKVIFDLLSFIR